MIRTRVDNKIIHWDLILLILGLFLGFLVFQKTDYNKSDCNSQSTRVEISIIKSNATVSTGIHFYHFQKTWIPNKNNFKLLSFDKSQFFDSKKVDQRILVFEKIRKNTIQFMISFMQYCLFPHESDEVPILS